MKKIACIFLLATSGLVVGQKNIVTVNGELVAPVLNANNGLTTNGNNVELGGTLLKPTVISGSAGSNILEFNSGGTASNEIPAIKIVDGLQAANKVLGSDAQGKVGWMVNTGAQNSYHKVITASVAAKTYIQSTWTSVPGATTYTAPVTGYYEVQFDAYLGANNTDLLRSIYLGVRSPVRSPALPFFQLEGIFFTNGALSVNRSGVILLNAGEVIDFMLITNSGANDLNISPVDAANPLGSFTINVIFIGS